MRHFSLVIFAFFFGCTKVSRPGAFKEKILKGEKIYTVNGSCLKPIQKDAKADGFLQIRNGELVTGRVTGCKSEIKYSLKWIRSNRWLASHPQAVKSCSDTNLDPSAQIYLDFEQNGNDYKLYLSNQGGCRWLSWSAG